jgi:hypothetical protein
MLTEDNVEQASFDPNESIHAAETGNQQERNTLNQDQPNPEPADLKSIKDLPKEVGVMLITAGIVGFILPGPGAPAIIAGGLVLWPEAFGKVESWLERSHPKVHRKGMQQINRFLNDLQKRYPDSTNG